MSDLTGAIVVVAWLLSAGVGAIIGAQSGKAGKGALLGLFFGPIGWVMMLCDIGPFGLFVTLLVFAGVAFFGISKSLREDREFEARMQRERNIEVDARTDDREPQRVAVVPTIPVATPRPIISRPTPDPRAAAAEIARKYGTKTAQ